MVLVGLKTILLWYCIINIIFDRKFEQNRFDSSMLLPFFIYAVGEKKKSMRLVGDHVYEG